LQVAAIGDRRECTVGQADALVGGEVCDKEAIAFYNAFDVCIAGPATL
jgi:hypothetical protein